MDRTSRPGTARPRPEDPLRLWTIRSGPEHALLERRGVLRTDGRRIPRYRQDAYAWMGEQLAKRVGPPPPGCRYPLWAWVQYGGEGRPQPDLRARGHCPPGTRAIRIEAVLSRRSVLLSDFQKWHAVLNRTYLADSERDARAFERALRRAGVTDAWPYPEPFASRVIQSWERVFELSDDDEAWWGPARERQLQAVFWELHAAQVRRLTPFVAR
ncbi:DUF3841 domain-containing protein [Archangium violaceum]|uniref:DUF3841 domain-containing protein n=1 Tax=Archangium violaceum TaxID=83451 RepID=UPI0036DB743E